jgi:hypothetical protein
MGGVIATDDGLRGKLPRLEGESPNVAPGTPLALIGLFIVALRHRFSSDPNEPLPWIWDANLKPEDSEDGFPPPDGSPRKIFIGAAYDVEKSVRNYRPAIYVDRGDITSPKLIVDNFVGQQLTTSLRGFWTLANVPITFYCESENAGESSLVADTAWFYILATRDIFRESFGLYDISHPTMGTTRPSEEDKEVWVTAVTFEVQLDIRWTTRPIAPLVREIALHIQNVDSPDEFYHEIVLRDLEK